MSEAEFRRFSREFKLQVLRRIEAGENVSALARELTIKRAILYRWRDACRPGGPEALRLRGRPSKTEAVSMAAARGVAGKANDLAAATQPTAAGTGFFQASLAAYRGITVTVHKLRTPRVRWSARAGRLPVIHRKKR